MIPEKDDWLARVEALIAELDDRMDTLHGLMREHLTVLRGYHLESMPGEYQTTVEMAKEILPDIEPPALRSRIGDVLNSR